MHIRLVVTMVVEFKSQECWTRRCRAARRSLETQNPLSARQHHTSIMTTLTMLTEDDSARVFLLVQLPLSYRCVSVVIAVIFGM